MKDGRVRNQLAVHFLRLQQRVGHAVVIEDETPPGLPVGANERQGRQRAGRIDETAQLHVLVGQGLTEESAEWVVTQLANDRRGHAKSTQRHRDIGRRTSGGSMKRLRQLNGLLGFERDEVDQHLAESYDRGPAGHALARASRRGQPAAGPWLPD